MTKNEILSHVDHTLLKQVSTWPQIRAICDEGIQYHTASVCIPPSFVRQAAEYAAGRIAICTVIGFPNGYNTTAVKCFETEQAVLDGADEIDMVVNLGMVRSAQWDQVLSEINAVKKSCSGRLLKVIVETCLLTEAEKIKLCEIVSESDADFIKTSTGFSTGGATLEDIQLFAAHVSDGTLIKAAGGIKSRADAEAFLAAGAERLGTSSLIRILMSEPDKED